MAEAPASDIGWEDTRLAYDFAEEDVVVLPGYNSCAGGELTLDGTVLKSMGQVYYFVA